jgi:hypothetical protein
MKNTNIGVANLVISNKLRESYFNGNSLDESKKVTFDFLNIVKNSPILQLEFKVVNNLENKHIVNDLAATRYIDNNIKLFEVYTIAEIDAEREKLNTFLKENVGNVTEANYDLERIKLYNAIDTLITESLNDYDKVDVDNIYESFTVVLNHVKEYKQNLIENVESEDVGEEILEIAVDKFNEKYAGLNEDEKNLLQLLIKTNDKEKKELLESYRTESLTLLEAINKDSVKENILKAIQKIKEMKYSKTSVVDDIIKLHELKRDLL